MRRAERPAGAALLVIVGVVHLNLYAREDYHFIPTVGWLFLLTVITSFAFAVLLFVRPGILVDMAACGFAVSVLGAYVLTLLLPQGLFLFKEPEVSFSGVISMVAEVGIAVLLGFDVLHRLRERHLEATPAPAAVG